MNRHGDLSKLLFEQRQREADILVECDEVVQKVCRELANMLGSPDDALRHCQVERGTPPRIGEPLGDVRHFRSPLPVLNPEDEFYCFALEFTFVSPVPTQGEVRYAIRLGIDGAKGEFTIKHINGKRLEFRDTDTGVAQAAEFVYAELNEEFSQVFVVPQKRIGFVVQ